jgi:hypothetical protein
MSAIAPLLEDKRKQASVAEPSRMTQLRHGRLKTFAAQKYCRSFVKA